MLQAKSNRVFATILIAGFIFASVEESHAAEITGRVTGVTLYRGQALVTRTVPIQGAAGNLEVVITNLPDRIVQSSLFAEGGEQVEIRAVQYRSRAVGEEPREEVRKLDEQIDELTFKISENQQGLKLAAARLTYLDKLENYITATGKNDFKSGTLDAISLEKIASFSFEQRKLASADQLALQRAAGKLQRELELLQRRRRELTGSSTRTVHEAVLFLKKNDADPQNVRLNYLVQNCGWSPTYTLRARSGEDNMQVEYHALIQQMSGESWDNVNIILSTASAGLSAAGPGIAPFRVSLTDSGQQTLLAQAGNQAQLSARVQSIKQQQLSLNRTYLNTDNFRDNTATAWNINGIVNEFQSLELLCAADAVTTLNTEPTETSEGPSLSYELKEPVSLPSRSDQQMVRILSAELPSTVYHVATPLLTSYVYREAELKNNSDADLLAGPMTMYLDGRFVGRGDVPTVSRGQTFVAGLGADPQLRVRRELASKSDEVQGGNRELHFSYKLFVENFSDAPVSVRLLDRLPVANGKQDIRIAFDQTSTDLSDDKVYQRRERPNGILRWDLTVPGKQSGEDALTVDYSYTVEFDRKFALTTSSSSTQQLQEEYEQLQRSRIKR